MTIEQFTAKLTNVSRRGRGYAADCPLHPDDGPGLRISREYGTIILECRKHCADHEIAKAVGLTAADLFDDDDDSFTGGYTPDDETEEETASDQDETIAPKVTAYDINGDVIRMNAFDSKPAAQWLKDSKEKPMQRKLFGAFWLEGEISILFADTGKGKSVLAVQIAESLASGRAIAPFDLDFERQKVLYFDFELSEKMFEARYSVPAAGEGGASTDHYRFDKYFIRAQLGGNPNFPAYYETWGEFLYHSFDELLHDTGAKLMIIDNITFLGTSSKERAGGAIHVMRVLHQFREEYDLSILVLAHTPKRPFRRGITVNDLQGSKMLSNFADNMFAIGESCLGEDVRYLKHIKPRNSPLIHGASKVCSYRIEKKTNFLQLKFTGFAHEREHLEKLTLNNETERQLLTKKVKELAGLGMSIRQISKELGISRTTVTRLLRSLE